MKRLLFALSLFECFLASAQPRFTDSTFGTNGNITQNTSLPHKHSTDILLQPDGKTVTLAEAEYDGITRVVLIRYNTNGTLDTTFSSNGIADSLINGNGDYKPLSLKIQPDGKLLVCGYCNDSANTSRGFVIRYHTNGSFDASFATGGILYLSAVMMGNITDNVERIKDLLVLPNNQLMLLTNCFQGNKDLTLIRLNSNGTPDNTWGTNGLVWLDACPDPYTPDYSRILLQTDGKLLVGGAIPYGTGTRPEAIVARITANGVVDNSYGSSGSQLLYPGPAANNVFRDMALQTDGKVVLSGTGSQSFYGYQYVFIVRLTTGGVLDAGFGSSGKQYLPYSSGFVSTEGQLSLQQDGKILLAGAVSPATGVPVMAVARLTTGGIPDISFDGDGIAAVQLNEHDSYGIAAMQQADGKIVVSGYANNNGNASVGVARLNTGGQTDNTVATAANIAPIGNGNGGDETGLAVHVQPADQKIVNLRLRFNGISYELRVSRYLPDGTPDNTFGANGTLTLELANRIAASDLYKSTILSNGKLLVVNNYTDFASRTRIELMQVNPNGTIDSSFGSGGRLVLPAGNSPAQMSTVQDVAFLPNDKVVLLTTQLNPVSYVDSVFLVQLNANGSLDAGFGTNGRRYLGAAFLIGSYDNIAAQSTGKIILSQTRFSPRSYTVSRFNTNGNPDNTFGPAGSAAISFTTQSLAVHPDDRIVMTSTTGDVYRLQATGRPDSSFGTAGLVRPTGYPYGNMNYTSLLAADSGVLFITGLADGTQPMDSAFAQMVKLKTNGRPDSSFGTGGNVQIVGVGAVLNDSKITAQQADGKLLVTGFYSNYLSTSFYGSAVLTRLKSNNSIGRLYTFTGNGLWSNPANWSDGTVPPTTITSGSSIVIEPPATGECIIDITVHVQAGATVTVKAGKKVRLPGNLIIQ